MKLLAKLLLLVAPFNPWFGEEPVGAMRRSDAIALVDRLALVKGWEKSAAKVRASLKGGKPGDVIPVSIDWLTEVNRAILCDPNCH